MQEQVKLLSAQLASKNNSSRNNSNNNTNITVQNMVGVWNITSLVYDDIDWVNVPGFTSASFIINSDIVEKSISDSVPS